MKRIILALAVTVFTVNANAQTEKKDWYNLSFENDGVHGAEVNKAYEFLSKSKAKYKPTVAIIGSGVDVQHEAIVSRLWVNKKEKADGVDNDGNGLKDDINGWNFIGQKDGNTMANVGKEGDRGWFLLRDKYADILKNGNDYYLFDNEGNSKRISAPADEKEFQYFNQCVKESKVGAAYRNILVAYFLKDITREIYGRMRERFPNCQLTSEDLKAVITQDDLKNKGELYGGLVGIIGMAVTSQKKNAKDASVDYMANVEKTILDGTQVNSEKEKYNRLLAGYPVGVRESMVGDKSNDLMDKKYGNNTLMTINANPSTMVATVITGERGVEGRNNPICPEARIMPLVVVDQEGEPYVKDVALAMRYAVDNGADIICFMAPNSLCPETQKVWLDDAMKYAENKGVLVVISTYNNGDNWDTKSYYPSRFTDSGKEFSNVIVVAPSTVAGVPVSRASYGAKTVDFLAPGEGVLCGIVGDTYKIGSGSILSMGVTAGIAALLKAYYPTLTAAQIRTILNETVTSRAGVEVEKEYRAPNNKMATDMFLFDNLYQSKGIINAYKAVQAADQVKK